MTHTVHKRIHQGHDGRIQDIEFDYTEGHDVGKVAKTVNISRDQYDRFNSINARQQVPFDNAVDVLNAFMKGSHARHEEIQKAFHILDSNHSGQISIHELQAVTGVIAPQYDIAELVDSVAKVDRDHNYRMDFSEFTNFIKRNVGRQIAFNHS